MRHPKLFTSATLAVASLFVFSCSGDKTSPTGPKNGDPLSGVNKIAFNNLGNLFSPEYALAVINPDGTNPAKIGQGTSTEDFLWTPDAQKLIFQSSNDNRFYAANTDGSGLAPLSIDGFVDMISPDDKQVCYYRYSSGPNIYVSNFDGTNERKLADNAYPTDWSPDGIKILFQSDAYYNPDERYALKSVEVNTAAIRTIVDYPADPTIANVDAKYLPDGSKIFYEQYRRNQPSFNNWFIIMDANGANPKKILENAERVVPSPDSKKLLFWREQPQGIWNMYTINPDGSGETRLVQNANDWEYAFASWSPDSKQIVFTAQSSIDIIQVDGRNRRKLIDFPDRYTEPIWSPR